MSAIASVRYRPKPKPDVRIEWRDPRSQAILEWSIVPEGSGSPETFGYDLSDERSVTLVDGDIIDVPTTEVVNTSEVRSEITFTARCDFDGTESFPVFWEWSFGDGFRAFGEQVTHSYFTLSESGQFQVVLTVTDNKNRKWRARKAMYIVPSTVKATLIGNDTLLTPAP
jgi:PKD domain